MTLIELILELERILEKHGDLPVRGTFEGTTNDIEIYEAQGYILIDCDDGHYKEQFQATPSPGDRYQI